MEIKRLMNSTYYKLVISQEELNEIAEGLGWSENEGMQIDIGLNHLLQDQLREFVTK